MNQGPSAVSAELGLNWQATEPHVMVSCHTHYMIRSISLEPVCLAAVQKEDSNGKPGRTFLCEGVTVTSLVALDVWVPGRLNLVVSLASHGSILQDTSI